MKKIRLQIQRSRKIPQFMKDLVCNYYITSQTTYLNGIIKNLRVPTELYATSKMADGVSMGADADGFFIYTHRARSKSRKDPHGFTKKEIDWIESTG